MKQREKLLKDALEEAIPIAEDVEDRDKIEELIKLQEQILVFNLEMDFSKKPQLPTLIEPLLKNPHLNEDDFVELFEILQAKYESSHGKFKDSIKTLINILCKNAIQRGFENTRVKIFVKHPSLKNNKEINKLRGIAWLKKAIWNIQVAFLYKKDDITAIFLYLLTNYSAFSSLWDFFSSFSSSIRTITSFFISLYINGTLKVPKALIFFLSLKKWDSTSIP